MFHHLNQHQLLNTRSAFNHPIILEKCSLFLVDIGTKTVKLLYEFIYGGKILQEANKKLKKIIH
jgi:hypothetical protein